MIVKIYPRFQSPVFFMYCIFLHSPGHIPTYLLQGCRRHVWVHKAAIFCFYGWTTAEQMCASCVNEGPSVGKVSVLEIVDSTWETEQQPRAADRTAGPEGVHFFPILVISQGWKGARTFPIHFQIQL